jgi:hypothetical protein
MILGHLIFVFARKLHCDSSTHPINLARLLPHPPFNQKTKTRRNQGNDAQIRSLTLVSLLAGGEEKWGQCFGPGSFPPGRWLDTLPVWDLPGLGRPKPGGTRFGLPPGLGTVISSQFPLLIQSRGDGEYVCEVSPPQSRAMCFALRSFRNVFQLYTIRTGLSIFRGSGKLIRPYTLTFSADYCAKNVDHLHIRDQPIPKQEEIL